MEISTDGFSAGEAKSYLQGQGYNIETKQEMFELIITAESVDSTDERFTMDNLNLGDNYKPLGALFRKASGEEFKEIADVEDLNENYQIGVAYFLKLKVLKIKKII